MLSNRNVEEFRTIMNAGVAKISNKITEDKRQHAADMTWELYRDQVLTSFQANEILLCMGFTTVRDSLTGSLIMFRLGEAHD